ncbi:MAG: MerR family transcriptional regulator [Chloroflexota bacterium]
MEQELTIQQVAAATGLSSYTLRYYERIGLLDPVGRATSGHRRYTTHDIEWIAFLNRLRAIGMPIRQMQEYAELRRQGACTITQRRILLEQLRTSVEEQINTLTENLEHINTKIDYYQTAEAECAHTDER